MTGLHYQVKQKANFGMVVLSQLKPNSREVAKRPIEQGELIKSKCGRGYVTNESKLKNIQK